MSYMKMLLRIKGNCYKMQKVIIIGAGISGATLANILANNNWQVEVYEIKNHIGGHCYDLLSKDNVLYHQYGPHIFHTERDNVIKFISQFAKFNGYINKVGVKLPRKQTQLPFNFKQIRKLDPKNGDAIVAFLKQKFPNQSKVSILELRKHREFEPLNKLTDWIFDNVYAPYTAKMWGIKITDIDPSVIARVGITLSDNESYFPTAKLQGLPVGGYTKMIAKMLDHKNIKVTLNFDALKALKIQENQTFWNGELVKYPIVYCGPIEALCNYKYKHLPYRSLEFKFQTFNTSKKQYLPIINLPKDPKRTRTVEYKQMTKQRTQKTVISTEYPGAFQPNAKKWNIPYYPINNATNNTHYQRYRNALKDTKNLYLLGRLAEYQYFDMDVAISSAIHLSERLLKQTKK